MAHEGAYWRWRLRGGAVTLAEEAAARDGRARSPRRRAGLSMLDVPAFCGHARAWLGAAPVALYLHETQPARSALTGEALDDDMAYRNWTSMVAADHVFVNSGVPPRRPVRRPPRAARPPPGPTSRPPARRRAGPHVRCCRSGSTWPGSTPRRRPTTAPRSCCGATAGTTTRRRAVLPGPPPARPRGPRVPRRPRRRQRPGRPPRVRRGRGALRQPPRPGRPPAPRRLRRPAGAVLGGGVDRGPRVLRRGDGRGHGRRRRAPAAPGPVVPGGRADPPSTTPCSTTPTATWCAGSATCSSTSTACPPAPSTGSPTPWTASTGRRWPPPTTPPSRPSRWARSPTTSPSRVGVITDVDGLRSGTGPTTRPAPAAPSCWCPRGRSPRPRSAAGRRPPASSTSSPRTASSTGSTPCSSPAGRRFGLAAADGVMAWLEERGRGFADPGRPGPDRARPSASTTWRSATPRSVPAPAEGRAACDARADRAVDLGTVGAGTRGDRRQVAGPRRTPVPAGSGAPRSRAGDRGRRRAGRGERLRLDRRRRHRRCDGVEDVPHGRRRRPRSGNTTIGVVATNARLDKVGCLVVAQGGHDGLARSLVPAHTRGRRRRARRRGHRGATDATGRPVSGPLTVAAVEAAVRSVDTSGELVGHRR